MSKGICSYEIKIRNVKQDLLLRKWNMRTASYTTGVKSKYKLVAVKYKLNLIDNL
jgi:hypothetical protein